MRSPYTVSCSTLLLLLLLQLHWTNPQSTNSLIPEPVGRFELQQFQLELDDFIREEQEQHLNANSRVKRTVLLNAASAIDVALLFGIPITTVLPVLANVFTNLNWSKLFKFKRSVGVESASDKNADSEVEYAEETTIIQPHLDKIRGYFELMRIPEPPCQERVICELSADPEKYFPVSELVLGRIRSSPAPLRDYTLAPEQNQTTAAGRKQKRSLFASYIEAADKGLIYGKGACTAVDGHAHGHMSRNCPTSLEERLDMNALQFWQFLSTMLGFNIRDSSL